jgi:hypothetical protein
MVATIFRSSSLKDAKHLLFPDAEAGVAELCCIFAGADIGALFGF